MRPRLREKGHSVLRHVRTEAVTRLGVSLRSYDDTRAPGSNTPPRRTMQPHSAVPSIQGRRVGEWHRQPRSLRAGVHLHEPTPPTRRPGVASTTDDLGGGRSADADASTL